MKKQQLFYCILALFIAFTSCQKDEKSVPINKKEQKQVNSELTQEQLGQIANDLRPKTLINRIPPTHARSSTEKGSSWLLAYYSQSNTIFSFTGYFSYSRSIAGTDYYGNPIDVNDIDGAHISWFWNVYNGSTGNVDRTYVNSTILNPSGGVYTIYSGVPYFNGTYYTRSDTWIYLEIMIVYHVRSMDQYRLFDATSTDWFFLQPYILT